MVYLAESLVKVNKGYSTIVLNTREQDVKVPNPVVRVVELDEAAAIVVAEREKGRNDPSQSRGEEVVAKLRTNHFNSEDNKLLH